MSYNFSANAANKSSFGAAAGMAKPGGVFGAAPTATTSAPSMFGASPSTANFSFGPGTQPGQSSIFGAQSPPAAQPSTGFNFGQTGQTAVLFGASPQTQSGGGLVNFGAKPATTAWPTFGSSTASTTSAAPTVGQFGQQAATNTFGQATSPGLFGQTAAAPAFGQTAAPTFGQTAAPAFGQTNPPAFGQTTTPAFGQTTAPTFGQTAAPAFGQTATPSFGQTAPTFGQTAAPATSAAPLSAGFGFGAPKPAQPSSITSPTPSFAFGQTAAPAATSASPNFSGYNFGQSPTTQKPTIGFGTAAPANPANPATSGVSFNFSPGTVATAPAPTTAMFGFSTSSPATSANPAGVANPSSSTIGFGSPTPNLLTRPATAAASVAPVLSFTTGALPQPSTAATQSGFSFASPNTSFASPSAATIAPVSAAVTAAPKLATLPSFGSPSQPSTAQSSGFSFAPASTAAAPTVSAAVNTATSAPASFTGFQVPASQPTPVIAATTTAEKPKPLGGGITLGVAPVSSVSSVAPSLSLPATTAVAVPSSAAPVPTFQLPVPATSSTATSLSSLTAPTATSTAAPIQPAPVTSMNFGQLEDAINKWSLELEEQEKLFINQATQVNAWDKLLIVNGEKIVTLNESLQSVRNEQQSLDHELDFILGQQRELEELLVPLEKELANVVISDPEREHTYRLADGIDTQLKQMSEDLKEIIEHLNESNRREDNNDPIVQIGRILNAHMSSMQWIDTQTAQISNKLGQLSSMHNTLKRQNKRSFHRTYN